MIRNKQWGYSALVPAATDVVISGGPMTWGSEIFPYRIPDGFWLAIKWMSFDVKLTDKSSSYFRDSFFVIENVKSLTGAVGHAMFDPPIVIPPTTELRARIINNCQEAQWMNVQMGALLVPVSSAPTADSVWSVV